MKATLILSASFTGIALVFAGIAAVAAQIGSEARTASSLAIGTMGMFYVARGYLETSQAPSWTRWITPFGWVEAMAPATDNNAWPLLACLASTIVLVGVAMALQQRRDFGHGLISPRPGAAEAPRLGIGRFAWRLHRGSVIAWIMTFALLGLVFGNLATSIGDVFAGNPAVTKILASGATTTEQLSFGFVATIVQIIGIIAAIMGAHIVMHVRAVESEFRLEPLLATPLRRLTCLASTTVLALTAEAAALLTSGTVLGLVASRGEAGIAFTDVVLQALATVPAVWVLTAISVAAIGANPKVRMVGWMVIVATFAITLLGPTFKFPNWAMNISPLHHVPTVTTTPEWWPVLALVAVTGVFLTIGFVGFSRRDIA